MSGQKINADKSSVFFSNNTLDDSRCEVLKEKMLSVGGREILIKAIAQAIPTYTMSCFQIPKSLCDEIEAMMRKFWWGQRGQESKIAWVSWKKMCKSKMNGGMGFKNLQAFNLAMLAKQGWRLISNPNSLVAQIYKARYYPHGDVFQAKLGSILILGGAFSMGWK